MILLAKTLAVAVALLLLFISGKVHTACYELDKETTADEDAAERRLYSIMHKVFAVISLLLIFLCIGIIIAIIIKW